jgi:hypothetical protein
MSSADDEERREAALEQEVADRLFVQERLEYHRKHPESAAVNGLLAKIGQIVSDVKRIVFLVAVVAILVLLVLGDYVLAGVIAAALALYFMRGLGPLGGQRPTWR